MVLYKVTIYTEEPGSSPLQLKTEKRKLASSVYELCQENGLKCDVTREVEPAVVKFRNL